VALRVVAAARKAAKAAHKNGYAWLSGQQLRLTFDSKDGLVVLGNGLGAWTTREHTLEVVSIGNLRALCPGNSLNRRALRGLERATETGAFSQLMALQLTPDMTFAQAAAAHNVATRHSMDLGNFHDFIAVHACESANGSLGMKDGHICLLRAKPHREKAYMALFEGIISPLLPFVKEAMSLLPKHYMPKP
jgi:hypothetical protein